jgi:hypothetical protein
MSRELRLSSPAAPWLQSLQPASHPHTPSPPNRRYFALNPIIDKFSFKKGCQVRSAGQYKTGTHIVRYIIWSQRRQQNVYGTSPPAYLWRIHKSARARARRHGAIFSRKRWYKSVIHRQLDLDPWQKSSVFVSLVSSPVQLWQPTNRPTVYTCTVTHPYIYPH